MQSYFIDYEYTTTLPNGKKHVTRLSSSVMASSLKFAKNKLMRKHKVKKLKVIEARVVGYY